MAANSRFVFVAAAIGLALRLAFGLGYWVDKPLTRDEREYLSLARSLAAGNGFVYDNEVKAERIEPFGRAPGYPVFLALTGGGRDVTTAVPATVKIAQAAAGAAGVLLVAAIAGRLAGPRAAKAAAALAAVYPPLVWISAYAFSEAIAWPLGLVVADVFDRALARTGPAATRYAIGAGLLAGIAALVRPGLLPFVVIAAAWLLIKRRPVPAAAFLLGAAIVIAPWTARNYAHYGRPVLIATEGGVTFWTGNHALAVGDGDLAGNPRLKLEKDALRARHPELNEEAMEPVYYREALSWIRSHPGDWVQLELRKLFYLIVPVGPSYALHSARYRIASVISYAVIAPLALVGFWRLRHRRARTPGLWLLATSAVAVALAFFPQERFRIPVIDPVLIISAASLAGSLARHDT